MVGTKRPEGQRYDGRLRSNESVRLVPWAVEVTIILE